LAAERLDKTEKFVKNFKIFFILLHRKFKNNNLFNKFINLSSFTLL